MMMMMVYERTDEEMLGRYFCQCWVRGGRTWLYNFFTAAGLYEEVLDGDVAQTSYWNGVAAEFEALFARRSGWLYLIMGLWAQPRRSGVRKVWGLKSGKGALLGPVCDWRTAWDGMEAIDGVGGVRTGEIELYRACAELIISFLTKNLKTK